jgi:alkylhydroperoxidase family enzyme
MATPDDLERQHTLSTATTRYDELRMRDALAAMAEHGTSGPLSREESLELLALSEVVIRKAGYGRQSMVRTARGAGASWTQIGAALGSSKQAAWEAHARWIEDQARQHELTGYEGLDDERADNARGLAGRPD